MTSIEALIGSLLTQANDIDRAVSLNKDDRDSGAFAEIGLMRAAADALSAALRVTEPFAEYAPGPNQSYFRDEMQFTQGSPIAKRQLTFGDLRAVAHWRQTGGIK